MSEQLAIKVAAPDRMAGDLVGLQGWRLDGVSPRYEPTVKLESGAAVVALA